jgi:hypothetical protein
MSVQFGTVGTVGAGIPVIPVRTSPVTTPPPADESEQAFPAASHVLLGAGQRGAQVLTSPAIVKEPPTLDAGLIVEFDGYVVHSSKGAFESDRHRQNQLVLAGYRVLRFTWQQLKDDPAAVVREIRAALAQGEPVIC